MIEEPPARYEPAEGEAETEQALMWGRHRFPDKACFDCSAGEIVPYDDEAVLFEVGEVRPESVVGMDADIRFDDVRSDRGDFGWAEDRRVPVEKNRC